MTRDEVAAARVKQGLPPTVTDPKVLNLLAALLAKPARGAEAPAAACSGCAPTSRRGQGRG